MAFADQLNAAQVLDQMEKLPPAYRFGILALVLVAILSVYWFTMYGSQRQELQKVQRRLTQLETKINESRAVASNLKSFQEKKEQLKEELTKALRRLPNSKELPVLLTDITSLGKKSGLEFQSFKPGREKGRGFYAEVPISIEVLGGYHDVGMFFDRLARLDRIVNVSNITMELASRGAENPRLRIRGVATTFRFVENKNAGGE